MNINDIDKSVKGLKQEIDKVASTLGRIVNTYHIRMVNEEDMSTWSDFMPVLEKLYDAAASLQFQYYHHMRFWTTPKNIEFESVITK